jgi:hypothetical protein
MEAGHASRAMVLGPQVFLIRLLLFYDVAKAGTSWTRELVDRARRPS